MVLVSPQDVHRVRLGDSARVELAAFRRENGRLIGGAVRSIGPQPSTAGGLDSLGVGSRMGSYRIDIALDSAQLALFGRDRLRRGYLVEGKILTRSGSALGLLWGYLRERIAR